MPKIKLEFPACESLLRAINLNSMVKLEKPVNLHDDQIKIEDTTFQPYIETKTSCMDETIVKKKTISCDQCLRVFFYEESLNQHNYTHQTDPLKPVVNSDLSQQLNHCSLCSETFDSMELLIAHFNICKQETPNMKLHQSVNEDSHAAQKICKCDVYEMYFQRCNAPDVPLKLNLWDKNPKFDPPVNTKLSHITSSLGNVTTISVQNRNQLNPAEDRTVGKKKTEAIRRAEYRERLSAEDKEKTKVALAAYMREYRARKKSQLHPAGITERAKAAKRARDYRARKKIAADTAALASNSTQLKQPQIIKTVRALTSVAPLETILHKRARATRNSRAYRARKRMAIVAGVLTTTVQGAPYESFTVSNALNEPN